MRPVASILIVILLLSLMCGRSCDGSSGGCDGSERSSPPPDTESSGGCSSPDIDLFPDDDVVDDDTGYVPPECEVSVVSVDPAPDATDAYWLGDLVFTLSAPDRSFTLLTDISGELEVTGDGTVVWWRLDEPLAPLTTYTVAYSTCSTSGQLSFTTSALGTALAEDFALEGQVYRVDLAAGRVLLPAQTGDVLVGYLDGDLLLSLTETAEGDLGIALALAMPEGAGQDFCAATSATRVLFDGSPWFYTDTLPVDLRVMRSTVPLRGAVLTGTLAPDGAYVGGTSLEGQLLGTEVDLALSEPFGTTCTTLAGSGDTCVPCAHDATVLCIPLLVDQLDAPLVPALSLFEVPSADCPGCEEGAPVCE